MRATSLYTREAHFLPTVRLKGVTHYTLRGKVCEKEYEQMPVLLLFFRQVKPALWEAPLGWFLFCLLTVFSFFQNLLTKAILRDMMYIARRGMLWIFN